MKNIIIMSAMRCELPGVVLNMTKGRVQNWSIKKVVCGIGREKVLNSLRTINEYGSPDLLLMPGFCGAVKQELSIGTIVIGTSFRFESDIIDYPYPATSILSICEKHIMPDYVTGSFETRYKAVLSKEGLNLETDVVDMESYFVAKYAMENRIPFLIVKSVSDIIPSNKQAILPSFRLLLRIMLNYHCAKESINSFFTHLLRAYSTNALL